LKSVNFQSLGTFISFDVVSLFTNVPVDEAVQVIRNKLHSDDTLAGRSVLQEEAIMELLEVCLRTTYFQADDKVFEQKEGMAVGGSVSPIVSKIFMKHFDKLVPYSAQQTPCCGSGTLMTRLWSGLMVQSGYRISSTTSIV
jgi:hypothetical protein